MVTFLIVTGLVALIGGFLWSFTHRLTDEERERISKALQNIHDPDGGW